MTIEKGTQVYENQSAADWTFPGDASSAAATNFHRHQMGARPTPLISLDKLAERHGLGAVLLKDETSRLGLPAFKILGASWACYRAVAREVGLGLDATMAELAAAAKEKNVCLFAATDGNHGRAVARMAKLLDISAHIFVPRDVDLATRDKISSEGRHVSLIVVDEEYDAAVRQAHEQSRSAGGVFVQDTAFAGYEEIPSWIIDGYFTILQEVDEQTTRLFQRTPDLVVCPVGVGSLAQAVVSHYKSRRFSAKGGGGRGCAVATVEPETASCLHQSLLAGRPTPTTSTGHTIMTGMNCGTVSSTAWPTLSAGVDVSLTVSDRKAHEAVEQLRSMGVGAGPCGAATLAAVPAILQTSLAARKLDSNSIVVLLCTEGARDYVAPQSERNS